MFRRYAISADTFASSVAVPDVEDTAQKRAFLRSSGSPNTLHISSLHRKTKLRYWARSAFSLAARRAKKSKYRRNHSGVVPY